MYAGNGYRSRNDKKMLICEGSNAEPMGGTDGSGKLSEPCKNQVAEKNKADQSKGDKGKLMNKVVAFVLRDAGVFYFMCIVPLFELFIC
jgi:hypothetical protein